MTRKVMVILSLMLVAVVFVLGSVRAGSEEPLVGEELWDSLGLELKHFPAEGSLRNSCDGGWLVEHPFPDSADGSYLCMPKGATVEEVWDILVRLTGRLPTDVEHEYFHLVQRSIDLSASRSTDFEEIDAVHDRIEELREACAWGDLDAFFCPDASA
jgi:hypothetical protein